jgi:hypothetical protein
VDRRQLGKSNLQQNVKVSPLFLMLHGMMWVPWGLYGKNWSFPFLDPSNIQRSIRYVNTGFEARFLKSSLPTIDIDHNHMFRKDSIWFRLHSYM